MRTETQTGVDMNVIQNALRKKIDFVSVKKMYEKPAISEGYEVEFLGKEFVLWKALVSDKQPACIIYDEDSSHTNGTFSYALEVAGESDVDVIKNSVPDKVWDEIQNIKAMWGAAGGDRQWKIIFKVLPVLRHVDDVRRLKWPAVIQELVNFRGQKMDERLRLARLCHLVRGVNQATNCHAIICLPGQTGKSQGYEFLGIKEEKAKANSMIGYSDTEDIHPGTVDGTSLTYAIDQFESQGDWQIFRYLQSLMESGSARVGTAAKPFVVTSGSTFVILANPGYGDTTKSFKFLVDHMVREPSFGRRFGLILYDKEAVKIDRREGKTDDWRKLFEFFRAVEEAAWPKIEKIFEDKLVWNWLTSKPLDWIKNCKEIIKPAEDDVDEQIAGLGAFLKEFVENGITHSRGGALKAAVALNMDKVLFDEISIEDLFVQAEEILMQLLDINQHSLQLIAKNFKEERNSGILSFFDSLPTYLKEITLAVQDHKAVIKPEDAPVKVRLSAIAHQPVHFAYFSQALERARDGNPEKNNRRLKENFGFEMSKENGHLFAVIYDNLVLRFSEFTRVQEGVVGAESQEKLKLDPHINANTITNAPDEASNDSRKIVKTENNKKSEISLKEYPENLSTSPDSTKSSRPSRPKVDGIEVWTCLVCGKTNSEVVIINTSEGKFCKEHKPRKEPKP